MKSNFGIIKINEEDAIVDFTEKPILIDIWMNGQNGSHHCFPLLAYWKRARVINRGSKDRNDCIRELMGNEPIDAWIKDIAKAIFFDPMQYEESNDWFKRISIIDFPPAFE